jgi:hypothetical protein
VKNIARLVRTITAFCTSSERECFVSNALN